MTELDNTFLIFTPPPNITATEWADEHFYISPESSSEPGKYNSARTPYVRGILDELTNPKTDTITLRGCRQVVKTTVILIGIGMSMDIDPCPMLLLEPTLDLAERVSKRRIAPMIRDTQVLSKIIGTPRSRDADNTILNKTFRGRALTISGANSPLLTHDPLRSYDQAMIESVTCFLVSASLLITSNEHDHDDVHVTRGC